MQFNFIWNASVSSAPSAFQAAVIAAGQQLATYFSNNITVNIQVGWGENSGTPINSATALATGGPNNGAGVSFAQLVTDFSRVSASGDDRTSVAYLQSIADPTRGGNFYLTSTQQKAMGLMSANATAADGTIGFASSGVVWDYNPADGISSNAEDFNAAALHEITHAMGRTRDPNYVPGWYTTMDLFGFSAPRSLQLTRGASAYFSPDGGVTSLHPYDTLADYGDWASSVTGDPFGYGARGVLKPMTAVDLREMDILGFTLSATGNALAHTITNTSAGATVTGTANDDIIQSSGADVTVTGGAGNDTITAGPGTNTSVYLGPSKNYVVTLALVPSALTTRDKVGTDGTDTLTNIQRLQFSDQTIDITMLSKTASLTSAQLTELVDLYVAYFNRAPDALGLDYWGAALKDGASFATLASAFASSPEAVAAYPATLSNTAFVTAVYTNVLGRNTDSGGLNFWVNGLQTGGVTKGNFVLNVIQSVLAQSGTVDAQYIANKYAVGAHFALTQGLSNGVSAKAVMSAVDGTAASVSAANAQTDAFATTAETTSGTEFVVKIVGIAA